MRFRVFHVHNSPININHRKQKTLEWREYWSEAEKRRPAPDAPAEEHQKAWEEAMQVEAKLEKKYPSKVTWSIHDLSQLTAIVEKYGTVSISKEGPRSWTIYLYPTAEEAQGYTDTKKAETTEAPAIEEVKEQ